MCFLSQRVSALLWYLPSTRVITRNSPSAGTERIDRIEECHSRLWNSIVFSSKTTSCNHSSHTTCTCTLECTRTPAQCSGSSLTWHGTVRCAARDIMRTVRYGIVIRKFKFYVEIFHCTVSTCVCPHWRSSSLVKNLERQWRNGWWLTRRLAMSVDSQVPICLLSTLVDNLFPWAQLLCGGVVHGALFFLHFEREA